METPPDSVFDEFEDIGPFEGIAAGQYEHGQRGELGQLIDQLQRLPRRELARARDGLRARAAMVADEVAGLRHFVKNQQRTVAELSPRWPVWNVVLRSVAEHGAVRRCHSVNKPG
jgi:hypothetical protein